FGIAESPVIPVHGAETRDPSEFPSQTTGGLILSGSPDKSLIILDGEERGFTPLILSGIEVGPHVLTITKSGYQTQTMEIYISQNRQTNFDFSLPPTGIPYDYVGMTSATGLNVYDNRSSPAEEMEPVGDPIYAWYEPGMSVELYGNYSSNRTDTAEVTTMYDENPYGDGFSVTVIATSDDTPFR
ncbi:MAG: PEGA domain-containing protein, partial [Methanospirillum sp.]|nr:PEGA domain-containing protein [Methanospirillum sp.]